MAVLIMSLSCIFVLFCIVAFLAKVMSPVLCSTCFLNGALYYLFIFVSSCQAV